jgi:proteasome lid subunit RPN8/RPN11
VKIKLTICRRLLREFRKRAIEAFPKETCCFLIGSDTEDKLGPIRYVEINEFWWPHDVNDHARTYQIDFQHAWFDEAKLHAQEAGLAVVGQMHSHPYTAKEIVEWSQKPDCADSEDDQDFFGWDKISGIFLVRQISGGGFRTRARFWGPRIPVEVG